MEKKSRFTRTDVNSICEMQKTIDNYKTIISDIFCLLNGKYVNRLKLEVPTKDVVEEIYRELYKRLKDGEKDSSK